MFTYELLTLKLPFEGHEQVCWEFSYALLRPPSIAPHLQSQKKKVITPLNT